MDFITARKEYNLLKRAYITGAISQEEFFQKIDTELEVTAEDGTVWKIDEDSGIWMVYVVDEQIWLEMPDVYPEEAKSDEQTLVKLEVPDQPPQVPTEVYRDWKSHITASTKPCATSPAHKPAPSANTSENTGETNPFFCQNCGRENRSGTKFCTGCGKPLDITRTCPGCGKKLQANNKFCTGCGQKID